MDRFDRGISSTQHVVVAVVASAVLARWLRRALLALTMAATTSIPTTPALAQSASQGWPNKPVRLVVPFAAGGNTDTLARIAAERLSSSFGQPFVVENRVGASGAIAAEFVARAAPDGYTWFVGATPNLLIVPLVQKVNYDGLRDFAPVAVIATNPFVLGIHPSIPTKTLAQFVAHVKANPDKFNYASAGAGSIGHLSGALLLARAGLSMAHVPYKGGAPAVADLVGGQVQMYFGNASELLPHLRGGKVTVLGVSTARRSRELPDVPTIAETYPGFLTYTLNGLLLPTGTPRDIQERVAQEMARMARDPVAIDRIHRTGSDPSSIGLGEFAELLRREQPLWIEAVKSAGIKPE